MAEKGLGGAWVEFEQRARLRQQVTLCRLVQDVRGSGFLLPLSTKVFISTPVPLDLDSILCVFIVCTSKI